MFVHGNIVKQDAINLCKHILKKLNIKQISITKLEPLDVVQLPKGEATILA